MYKITGVRGSGKTVIMANVQKELSSEENSDKGWLVYTLNPSRDMLVQLAAYLYSEKFIKESIKNKIIRVYSRIWQSHLSIQRIGNEQNVGVLFVSCAGVYLNYMLIGEENV